MPPNRDAAIVQVAMNASHETKRMLLPKLNAQDPDGEQDFLQISQPKKKPITLAPVSLLEAQRRVRLFKQKLNLSQDINDDFLFQALNIAYPSAVEKLAKIGDVMQQVVLYDIARRLDCNGHFMERILKQTVGRNNIMYKRAGKFNLEQFMFRYGSDLGTKSEVIESDKTWADVFEAILGAAWNSSLQGACDDLTTVCEVMDAFELNIKHALEIAISANECRMDISLRNQAKEIRTQLVNYERNSRKQAWWMDTRSHLRLVHVNVAELPAERFSDVSVDITDLAPVQNPHTSAELETSYNPFSVQNSSIDKSTIASSDSSQTIVVSVGDQLHSASSSSESSSNTATDLETDAHNSGNNLSEIGTSSNSGNVFKRSLRIARRKIAERWTRNLARLWRR